MFKQFIAALLAITGYFSANAALVRLDVGGEIIRYYEYASNSYDSFKIGNVVSTSLVIDTGNGTPHEFSSPTQALALIFAHTGCYDVIDSICSIVPSSNAPMVISAQYSIDTMSFDTLNLPIEADTTIRLLKYWDNNPYSKFDVDYRQWQEDHFDPNHYQLRSSIRRTIEIQAAGFSSLTDWYGDMPPSLIDELTMADMVGLDYRFEFNNSHITCESSSFDGTGTVCSSYTYSADSIDVSARVTSFAWSVLDSPANDVPEPGTLALMCSSLIALFAGSKKRKHHCGDVHANPGHR